MTCQLVVGTRGSALALWQTHWIAGELQRSHQDTEVVIERISSPADRLGNMPLAGIGTTGLFTRDLDEALSAGRIDMAVHSLKDVPSVLAPGLSIGAMPPREDPRDVLVMPPGAPRPASVMDLPRAARVGTDSVRRAAQLLHQRPDLRISSIRGNVDTRLRKLDNGEYDIVVLAAAGLHRLGLAQRITLVLTIEECLPAPGQGVLAVTMRTDDVRLPALLAPLHDAPTAAAAMAERALLRHLGGGCQAPIGALATFEGNDYSLLRLRGMVASRDGHVLLHGEAQGPADATEDLAKQVATILIDQGARDVLAAR